jgi:hexosaminidase
MSVHEGSIGLDGCGVIVLRTPDDSGRIAVEKILDQLDSGREGRWSLSATDHRRPGDALVSLGVDQTSDSPPQGYRLTIGSSGIEITGRDSAGLFYGAATLVQLLQTTPLHRVPFLEIDDAPTICRRGVMLDVSRDRVPTMETVFGLVDLFASWKLNELQLYMEQSFAYVGHEAVWGDESPFTPAEIITLDAYCRARHIDLVPNQNTLGHLHKWLENPRYEHLAENFPYEPITVAPHVMHRGEPFWGDVPYSINPNDPDAVRLVESLLDELLPNFSSRTVNVGLDEPFDLSMGRSAGAGDPVDLYLRYVDHLYARLSARGYDVQMWGDFVAEHPESAHRLPDDIVVVDWGYWATHPFRDRAQALSAAGRRFSLATGTNAWCSLGGRTFDTIEHMRAATDAAIEFGAEGILITDWGWFLHGTYQQHPISFPGFLLGAGESWSPEASRIVDVRRALSAFAFGDADGPLGPLLWELGEVCPGGGRAIVDNSPLYWAMREDLAWIREHCTVDAPTLIATLDDLARFDAVVDAAEIRTSDGWALREELRVTIRLQRHGALRALLALTDDGSEATALRRRLADDLPGLVGAFSENWIRRYRVAGLAGTASRISSLESDYRDES